MKKQPRMRLVDAYRNSLSILLLIASIVAVNAKPLLAAPVQPQLLHLATENPQALFTVIIQTTNNHAVEPYVRAFGGSVLKHIPIINAFTAQVPGQAINRLAQAPGVRYISIDGVMNSAGSTLSPADVNPIFTTWATTLGTVATTDLTDAVYLVDESGLGPDGHYAHHWNDGNAALAGFDAQITPGYVIDKVEVVFAAFVNKSFTKDLKLKIYVDGAKTGEVKAKTDLFHRAIGPANPQYVYIDITSANQWQWADFSHDLQIKLEIRGLDKTMAIFYDAVGLRISAVPGMDLSTNAPAVVTSHAKAPINPSNLVNVFPFAVQAPDVWNAAPAFLQGQGMTVAVVDSGIGKTEDLKGRNVKNVNFNSSYHDSNDKYGHGTFVASMIAGNGKKSNGAYLGIAPQSQLLNVRVSDDQGMAYESDVIAALQWIYENSTRYNIRVVNLSLNASVPTPYHLSPLNAAVEVLWFNGIVVVAAAGNNGTADLYPPANDPFVITVGATDDQGTRGIADDTIGSFSAYGTTVNGQVKPNLVAPGKDIVMYLPSNQKLTMGRKHSSHSVDHHYFRMSGTSLAAPIVAGAVALLLQAEPQLTPDQVKYRLMTTANRLWPGYDAARAGAGYLDINAAINSTTIASTNGGIPASQLLWSGPEPVTWGSVSWNSVSWNSVSWNSVSWNSVSWNSVSWNSDYWDEEVDVANAQYEQQTVGPDGLPTPLNVVQWEEQKHILFLPTVMQ